MLPALREPRAARREEDGWDRPGFKPSAPLWSAAIRYPKAADLGPLSLFTTPPIRITESRSPHRIYRDGADGIWNFGKLGHHQHPSSAFLEEPQSLGLLAFLQLSSRYPS